MADLIYSVVLYPIIYIWPAYVANGAPVIFGRGPALDLGRMFRGKPVFGKHKTIIGLIAGILSGMVMAAVESAFLPYMLLAGIAMALGTHFGDLLGSFLKRQLGFKEGRPFLLFDQYFFFIFALLFALPFGHMPSIYGLVFLVMLTGVLHKLTNMGAHKAKLKDVPW
jgi:CDP-2,3-bis-(O-geranylgeranyl)-sn-glycerol synthase